MTSSFSKFYNKTKEERLNILEQEGYLSHEMVENYASPDFLAPDIADALIENQISQFPLPLGVALNFVIDDKKYVVPMVVEEPSVIAACSNAGRLTAPKGFKTTIKQRHMIGQIILKNISDITEAISIISSHKTQIIEIANHAHPSIVARGGGVKDIILRPIENENGIVEFLTIHLLINVKDAMGANIINTILEGVTPYLLTLVNGASLMSILSNFNTEALVTTRCEIPFNRLETTRLSGRNVGIKIAEASRYAQLDPYRAATHNKGIMNGIDSVVIATGNDPRAVEAGVHAYAAKNGRYQGLSKWTVGNDCLHGELTIPLAIGTVGGAISVLPMAKNNLALLNCHSSQELARIIASVGLAQNLAALKALVTDGIQKGHMTLHASSLAIQVGAKETEIEQLTLLLQQEQHMNSSIALNLLKKIREQS